MNTRSFFILRSLSRVSRSPPSPIPSGDFFEQAAVLEADDAVGDVEMVLVVTDDQERLARGPQFGEQRVVEHVLEGRILIGGPFIEDADRPILQQGAQQGQSPALPL